MPSKEAKRALGLFRNSNAIATLRVNEPETQELLGMGLIVQLTENSITNVEVYKLSDLGIIMTKHHKRRAA